MKQVVWTMALVSLMMAGGCIKPGAGATPEETLRNLVGALQAGDELAVVDCFKASPAGKELLKIISSSTKALLDFTAKMTTAYGADTVKTFGFGNDRFTALVNHVGEAKIVTSGDDRATATVPGWPGAIPLVKDTTTMLWRIAEPRYIEMTEAQLNSGFRVTRHLRDAMIMVMNEIGTPGVTADAIIGKMETFIKAEMVKPLEPIHVPPAEPEPAPADPHTSPTRPTLPDPKLIDPHAPTTRPTLPDLPPPPKPSSRITLPEIPKPRVDLPDPGGHGGFPTLPAIYADLSTPQKTLAFMAKALSSGNGQAMLRCFKTNAEGQRGLLAMTEAMKTVIDFSTKMQAAYGKRAGQMFGGDEGRALVANISRATITIDGDKALAKVPDADKLKLVRENGQWLIYENDIANASKKDIDQMLAQTTPMVAAMKRIMPQIGQPGQTADSIEKQVKDAMRAAAMR